MCDISDLSHCSCCLAIWNTFLYAWDCGANDTVVLQIMRNPKVRYFCCDHFLFNSQTEHYVINLRSVHHRTIQINHQPDATIFQFIFWRLFTAQHVSGVFQPIIRSSMTLVLPSYRGVSRAVFVVEPTTNTARLSPRYEGKTRGCHCSHWAPDDGRKKRPKHVEL